MVLSADITAAVSKSSHVEGTDTTSASTQQETSHRRLISAPTRPLVDGRSHERVRVAEA
jgi:hypothetical protein